MEVNYGNKSDSMKKIEKQSIPNVKNLFTIVKSTLKRFGFIKPSSDLKDEENIRCCSRNNFFSIIKS